MCAAGSPPRRKALGVEIYPGFAAAEVLYGDQGEVVGVATGDMGIGKKGEHKDSFTRGMELRAKYTLFAEGARGSLSKQLIAKFELAKDREPQKFGIGLKELWKVAPEKHQARPGAAYVSAGRSTTAPAAARSSITSKTGRSSSASWCTSTTEPVHRAVRGIPALQAASADPADLRRRQAHLLRRARDHRRAAGSRCRSSTFPGGALIGCAAGFINLPRIKGSHNAILSGMLAAEHVAAALADGRIGEELVGYENAWRDSRHRPRPEEGAQRQAVLVEARHHARLCFCRARHVDQYVRLFAVRHAEARQAGLGDRWSRPRSTSRSPIRSPTAS